MHMPLTAYLNGRKDEEHVKIFNPDGLCIFSGTIKMAKIDMEKKAYVVRKTSAEYYGIRIDIK